MMTEQESFATKIEKEMMSMTTTNEKVWALITKRWENHGIRASRYWHLSNISPSLMNPDIECYLNIISTTLQTEWDWTRTWQRQKMRLPKLKCFAFRICTTSLNSSKIMGASVKRLTRKIIAFQPDERL